MNRKHTIFFLLVFIFFSCNLKTERQDANKSLAEQKNKTVTYNVSLVAAGDNLFHEPIIRTHQQGNSFNFSPIYSEVESIIKKADFAFINQETVMGGEHLGYSGYPLFNTPQSLATTLADTGFNIVNLANNHAMDKGRAALYATLDLFDGIYGITVIGARKAGPSHRIVTKNNINLGFLSYTYGLNGHTLPAGEPNLVSLINKTRMSQEINTLRPLCDFLIVSMHWGDEYVLIEPGVDQVELAIFLSEHNVDLVIGHHPHVLQRVEIIHRPDGKQTLCFYSLGNYVSNQREKDRVLGAMMYVNFSRTETGQEIEHTISDYGLIPIITHFESGFLNTKVYPLHLYSEALLGKHYLRLIDKTMDYKYFMSVLTSLEAKLIIHNPFD